MTGKGHVEPSGGLGMFDILIWEAVTQVYALVKTHRALTECLLALTRIKNKIAYDTNLVLEMKAWENVQKIIH